LDLRKHLFKGVNPLGELSPIFLVLSCGPASRERFYQRDDRGNKEEAHEADSEENANYFHRGVSGKIAAYPSTEKANSQ
jgi:hypothetical protein